MSRGDITKQTLITTAIEIFGRDGFHAASTREIAAQAQVNQASIGYHFGGKDALYLAAIKYIADQIAERMEPIASEIAKEVEMLDGEDPGQSTTREHYVSLLIRLIDALLRMLVDQKSSAWAKLILREQQTPSEAFDVFYEGLMGKVFRLTAYLVGRIRNIEPQSEEARLLAITLFGQAIVFRASRAAVLRYMGWSDFSGKDVAAIQIQLRTNIRAMFNLGEPL